MHARRSGGRPQGRGGVLGTWSRSHWSSTGRSGRSVALACAATFGLHLLFLSRELTSDEGGFAMVARGWRAGGPYLYGTQWVDRPPGLMVVFEAAQGMGGLGVRLTAAICATALVAAAAWAAGAVRGGGAATWAAWTAFAFATSPFLEAYQLNGELVAAPLVMLAAAAVLDAVHRSRPPVPTVLLGLVAGAAAASALLVKQDFADGLVFVAVLLGGAVVLRRTTPRRGLLTAAGVVAGAVAPMAAAAAWAATHAGVGALGYAMYGFRADAGDVIAMHSLTAPETRLETLLGLAVVSGIALVVLQLAAGRWRALLRPDPLVWAVTAAAAVELVGVLLGANYWPHYLIALVPMLALAAGMAAHPAAEPAGQVAGTLRGGGGTRLVVVIAVLTTAVAAPVAAVSVHTHRSHPDQVGWWLASSAAPADTVVVPFTHANVIEASGLSSPYPYSWSLPVRTLDPRLDLLTRTLSRRRGAPTWVVRWDAPHTWGLDPHDRVDRSLRQRYRQVAVVCGRPVWLHRGVRRALAAVPEGCGASYPISLTTGSS